MHISMHIYIYIYSHKYNENLSNLIKKRAIGTVKVGFKKPTANKQLSDNHIKSKQTTANRQFTYLFIGVE